MSKIRKSEKDSLSVIKIPVTGEVPLETLDVVLKVASLEAVYSQASMDKVTDANDLLVEKLEDELILAHLENKRMAAEQAVLINKLEAVRQELNDLSYTERIINTLRDPLIVMDKDLKVMMCTSGFYNKFR